MKKIEKLNLVGVGNYFNINRLSNGAKLEFEGYISLNNSRSFEILVLNDEIIEALEYLNSLPFYDY